ncbi:hypothetical protein M0802_014573 [Mischocyttarus mexicanus]|nr:hypothetical protein M0802_014573 [Mischocyttarus mexicanus]
MVAMGWGFCSCSCWWCSWCSGAWKWVEKGLDSDRVSGWLVGSVVGWWVVCLVVIVVVGARVANLFSTIPLHRPSIRSYVRPSVCLI